MTGTVLFQYFKLLILRPSNLRNRLLILQKNISIKKLRGGATAVERRNNVKRRNNTRPKK